MKERDQKVLEGWDDQGRGFVDKRIISAESTLRSPLESGEGAGQQDEWQGRVEEADDNKRITGACPLEGPYSCRIRSPVIYKNSKITTYNVTTKEKKFYIILKINLHKVFLQVINN